MLGRLRRLGVGGFESALHPEPHPSTHERAEEKPVNDEEKPIMRKPFPGYSKRRDAEKVAKGQKCNELRSNVQNPVP
jgi:hypothetical protein